MPFRDSLEHKKKSPCCNDLCQVAVLKELVNRTLERDFTKAINASVWSWFFIKMSMKVFSSVFYQTVLRAGTSIGAFIQHLTHFWLGFLELFLWGVQNCTPVSLLLKETCCSNNEWQIYRPSQVLLKIA